MEHHPAVLTDTKQDDSVLLEQLSNKRAEPSPGEGADGHDVDFCLSITRFSVDAGHAQATRAQQLADLFAVTCTYFYVGICSFPNLRKVLGSILQYTSIFSPSLTRARGLSVSELDWHAAS